MKNNQITKKEAIQLQIDMDKKLQYEIDNMVRSNHRLLSEQVTSFVPILFSEGCNLGLKRTLLTSYRCNRAIKKINQIDFTLFSRELIFSDQKAGIVKDYVIKEIYPDIVLFPCYGSRGTMWQEITGRKRDTPGRFMFPIFLETDELSAMLPIIGRFRWEMCRTIQGMKWNDIREKSLTSEYQDYIQFFRKNNSLSEEWKEKIRNQIKASRNNTKEIFTRDYIEWVTRESTGGVRLNKVSREILSTYCPFNKEIREQIGRAHA